MVRPSDVVQMDEYLAENCQLWELEKSIVND